MHTLRLNTITVCPEIPGVDHCDPYQGDHFQLVLASQLDTDFTWAVVKREETYSLTAKFAFPMVDDGVPKSHQYNPWVDPNLHNLRGYRYGCNRRVTLQHITRQRDWLLVRGSNA